MRRGADVEGGWWVEGPNMGEDCIVCVCVCVLFQKDGRLAVCLLWSCTKTHGTKLGLARTIFLHRI
jgi:hypothetical protein